MSTSRPTNASWKPVTEADRERVLAELHSILASHHFRNSKRYPALLEYVVMKAIDGDTAQIKERTLGVEVFDRRPDYDTNEDPVVRFSASAVRKKIAQYYQETGNAAGVHIELPLGSYVPEFHVRLAEDVATPDDRPIIDIPWHLSIHKAETTATALGAIREHPARGARRLLVWSCLALFLLVAAAWTYEWRKSRASVVDQVWAPLLQPPGNVLIILGDSHPELGVEPPQTTVHDHLIGPYQHVSLSSATSMARLCGLLDLHGKKFDIREDPIPTFTDLRSRPIILIGGMNNFWTLRLDEHLPFRFHNGPVAEIFDAVNPSGHRWQLDFSQPFLSIVTDYAVVARYQDAATDGPVVIVAGLGPYGTETAAEFVASPRFLGDMAGKLPRGWERRNFEVVLKTNVIKGNSGPPSIVATTTW